VWRVLRKTAHVILTPQASEQHLPIQKAEATQLMYDILNDPEVRLYLFRIFLSVFSYSLSTALLHSHPPVLQLRHHVRPLRQTISSL
jgi:hypothetical protein